MRQLVIKRGFSIVDARCNHEGTNTLTFPEDSPGLNRVQPILKHVKCTNILPTKFHFSSNLNNNKPLPHYRCKRKLPWSATSDENSKITPFLCVCYWDFAVYGQERYHSPRSWLKSTPLSSCKVLVDRQADSTTVRFRILIQITRPYIATEWEEVCSWTKFLFQHVTLYSETEYRDKVVAILR